MSAPARMRIGSHPTIRSWRCNGCSTARPSADYRRAARTKHPAAKMPLRLYTVGSAWFCFDETRRGTLETGKLADFAILDRDFMSVPLEQIGATASLLTVVGGKVVYAADAFASAK